MTSNLKKVLRLIISLIAFWHFGCSAPDQKAIHVIYSGGIAGYLQPCGCREGRVGGMARLAGAIQDSLKRWKSQALILDAGEFAESYGSDIQMKNRILLESFALMKYDAINVTARDLMVGTENLGWAADSLGLSLISANLMDRNTGRRLFPGWTIREFQSRTIGIIGAGAIRPLEMRKAGIPSVEFCEPDSAIRDALGQIGGQCDWIILLCDFTARASRDMAARIPGLDLIISTGEIMAQEQARKFGAAYVVGVSRKGKQITALRLSESGDSLNVALSKALLDSTVKADERVKELVASHQETSLFK